ncbi:uncharacterized protein E0L32_010803 [Thyridium curvatum]|uniref:Ribosome biogenesis protein RLP24 n=1 Tax=Thyridium curvatum TaxID=1093900 RepID=A0A507ALH1_9PEZI|nr:uncharacterized protein E0L32_010803 [Thyridium curvatum]TPX07306.1 hypothetical protein E0L32_010803 [Thyridium curvatum]
MKRNPRKLKWTKAHRQHAGKEMTVDSTLLFAARRNVPVRYDRELMAKTLQAIKRVNEVRTRRERVFYKKRMAGKRERELAAARKLVSENEHLLPRLRGSEKRMLAERAREEGLDAEELEQEVLSDKIRSRKTRAFGAESKRSVRVLMGADGSLQEEVVEEAGVGGGDFDEEDDDDVEDDEMDMD